MKSPTLLLFPIALLASGISVAQEPTAPPMIEAVPAEDPGVPTVDGGVPRIEIPAGAGDTADASVPPPPLQEAPAIVPSEIPAAPQAGTFAPLEQQKLQAQQAADGFIIKDAQLNEIFQFLAKSAGRQYFHNVKISGPDYLVTGHLNDGNPLEQMEELAFQYGLSLHTKGNTIYALTQAQLSQLPASEFHYQLKYLRPTDIEQIKELVKPILSPSGIVNFEPKTGTIIIIDSAHRIEQARTFLSSIDQAKGQIVVETKILRVNSRAAERTGINWETSLGTNGVSVGVARDLASVFGLPSQFAGAGTNLVLDPLQLSGLLRLLAEGKLAQQVSNPTLITEDNEQASISIIDRIPIITTSITQSSNTANPTVTEELRYKIDPEDKAITEDRENHREIGISIVVTPTLLPDGTVRMKLRPRSAQIAEYVESLTGNRYPRVTESMVESLARVPDGHSLVVGGFYGEVKNNNKNKIPLLGDVPVLNFFFKSKEAANEQTSLVFIVTPKSYNPASAVANNRVSGTIRRNSTLPRDHDWVDPYNPGPAHEPNLGRTARGLQPQQAPYYPRAEELKKKKTYGRP